jgi:hypothetical protein
MLPGKRRSPYLPAGAYDHGQDDLCREQIGGAKVRQASGPVLPLQSIALVIMRFAVRPPSPPSHHQPAHTTLAHEFKCVHKRHSRPSNP